MSKLKDKTDLINEKISTLFLAMHHEDTPLYAKLACGLCVYYALSPIDLVPDFIPVLGYLDDLVILPFLLWLSIKMVPEDIMNTCRRQAKEIMNGPEKNKKRYAIPILCIWALLAVWIGHLVYKYFFI